MHNAAEKKIEQKKQTRSNLYCHVRKLNSHNQKSNVKHKSKQKAKTKQQQRTTAQKCQGSYIIIFLGAGFLRAWGSYPSVISAVSLSSSPAGARVAAASYTLHRSLVLNLPPPHPAYLLAPGVCGVLRISFLGFAFLRNMLLQSRPQQSCFSHTLSDLPEGREKGVLQTGQSFDVDSFISTPSLPRRS